VQKLLYKRSPRKEHTIDPSKLKGTLHDDEDRNKRGEKRVPGKDKFPELPTLNPTTEKRSASLV
jgi:hypothetical protein